MTPQINLPPKLIPVFEGTARVRGAYGGRGSGKTRSFAIMAAAHGARCAQAGRSGIILCVREFMNSLDDSSMAEVKEAIESDPFLSSWYDIGEKYIRTRDCGNGARVDFKFAGLNRNINSVKSKSRILLCWADEAEPIIETAWQKLIPSVRADESEIWVTWNPERKDSATHKRFREDADDDMKIVEMNYTDNPKFPLVLDNDRKKDAIKRPESYDHVWGGAMKTYIEGAYYSRCLLEAKDRIGNVGKDPLMTIRAIWDIGGTGAKADATAIWIVQYIGHEVRVLDYYEAQGQPLSAHIQWLKDNGYEKALCVLPHDGATHDKVHSVSYESALDDAGFETKVIPNQGKGAAMQRIEAARRLFPQMWFNKDKTEAGRDALAWYHEKKDEERAIGLGPNHDWASHGADAFGMIAIDHATHEASKPKPVKFKKRKVL